MPQSDIGRSNLFHGPTTIAALLLAPIPTATVPPTYLQYSSRREYVTKLDVALSYRRDEFQLLLRATTAQERANATQVQRHESQDHSPGDRSSPIASRFRILPADYSRRHESSYASCQTPPECEFTLSIVSYLCGRCKPTWALKIYSGAYLHSSSR